MPAYYTKTRQEHPVYHSTVACEDFLNIDPINFEAVPALVGRQLCAECAKIEANKAK